MNAELLDRARRSETRLHALCDVLGLSKEVNSIVRCDVARRDDEYTAIAHSADTPMSVIKHSLEMRDVDVSKPHKVVLKGGKHFATIMFEDD